MRPVPQIALDFIDGAEADRLKAYRDDTGRWTIGRGHTGPEVVEGLVITEAQSLAYRFADATKAAARVCRAVKDSVIQSLSEHQWSALISFSLNLGFDPHWQIAWDLNRGKLDAVTVEMMRFDKEHKNGKVIEVPGLHNRRAAEVALWKTADVASAITVAQAGPEAPPSSYTRDAVTPPTAYIGKAFTRSKTAVATCVSACIATVQVWAPQVKGALDQVSTTIQPYVGQSDVLQQVSSHLALIGAGVAVLAAGLAWLKNRTSAQ